MTDAQFDSLADRLQDTNEKLGYALEALGIDYEIDSDLWERLDEEAGLNQCKMCGYWLAIDLDVDGACEDCSEVV